MVYPTAVRSRGTGWAQAFGRLGSLAAQVIGGWLFARRLSMQEIYLTPALVLLAGAAAAALLVVVCYRRFGGLQLDDVARNGEQARSGRVTGTPRRSGPGH